VSERAAPFYCPYCGDEDIRPDGEHHGQWRCGACTRVWTLKYVGLGRPSLEQEEAR
jgi:transposase-like protein